MSSLMNVYNQTKSHTWTYHDIIYFVSKLMIIMHYSTQLTINDMRNMAGILPIRRKKTK